MALCTLHFVAATSTRPRWHRGVWQPTSGRREDPPDRAAHGNSGPTRGGPRLLPGAAASSSLRDRRGRALRGLAARKTPDGAAPAVRAPNTDTDRDSRTRAHTPCGRKHDEDSLVLLRKPGDVRTRSPTTRAAYGQLLCVPKSMVSTKFESCRRRSGRC